MDIYNFFSAKAIAMYWDTFNETANSQPYFGTSFFPVSKKMGLDLKFIKGKSGLPVVLKPAVFDTEAKIRDRIGVESLSTEMPFFREGFLIKERDRQDILRAQDSNDPYAQAVLNTIFDDAKNLILGANVVPERMIMQLLAPVGGSPKISISSGGVNYDYDYDEGGSFASENYMALSGTSVWTDYENSDPIEDLKHAKDKLLLEKGVTPSFVLMSSKTMRDILKNAKVKSYVISAAQPVGGTIFMTSDLIKKYILNELGLTCIINDKKFVNENGVSTAFFPDDIATLIPAEPLGNTWYGTTPEEADLMSNSKRETSIVNTGVAITTVREDNPVNVQTIASEIVLPSFEGMDKIFAIKTA